MNNCKPNILNEAIARNSGIVLSLPSAGMLRHHKSRFLGPGDNGIWVESATQEAPLIDALIASAKPSGISFKSGATKVVFTAPLLRRDPAYRVNSELTVEAVLVAQPAEIKAVQRRATYRVRVPEDFEITVRVWRMGREQHLRDRPMAATQLPVKLFDISTGGMGVIFKGERGEPPRVDCEDRLRVELTCHSATLLIEASMRYPGKKPDGDTIRAGLQFQALQGDMDGRRQTATLTRIVGELQRMELRRFRLGIA